MSKIETEVKNELSDVVFPSWISSVVVIRNLTGPGATVRWSVSNHCFSERVVRRSAVNGLAERIKIRMSDVRNDSLLAAVGKTLTTPDQSFGWSSEAMQAAKSLAAKVIAGQ